MRAKTAVTGLAAIALAAGAYTVGANQHVERATAAQAPKVDLWQVYTQQLKKARYVDLTHTITPNMPVWKGFGPAQFSPAVDPLTGQPYTYAEAGFEATSYLLRTDQFGTQLDPPAPWGPEDPGIAELPPAYAV